MNSCVKNNIYHPIPEELHAYRNLSVLLWISRLLRSRIFTETLNHLFIFRLRRRGLFIETVASLWISRLLRSRMSIENADIVLIFDSSGVVCLQKP